MDSLRGQLLVASPALVDPNFRRTVVLIAEHTEEGAMGLILNRPSEATVGAAVPDLDGIVAPDVAVEVGGPVAEDQIVLLCDFEDPEEAGLLVFGSVGLPAADADLEELAQGIRTARVFAGHAGWGPGQLDAELETESWVVEEPLYDEVFPPEGFDIWGELWRRKGGAYGLLATMPLDPSLN